MTLLPDTPVGEVAAQFPATVRVFQRRQVEFCCGGRQTLAEVCRHMGIPCEILVAELNHAIEQAPVRLTWADRPLPELTAHIADAFHEPLRQELPRLQALIARLQSHGDAHRRVLTVVERELGRFEAALVAQTKTEEDVLFPLVDRIEAGILSDEERLRLDGLRRETDAFHQHAAQTIRRFRRITGGYAPPPNACATLRSLYRGLEEFEQLMQMYVHLETNVLFSRAAASTCRAGVESQS